MLVIGALAARWLHRQTFSLWGIITVLVMFACLHANCGKNAHMHSSKTTFGGGYAAHDVHVRQAMEAKPERMAISTLVDSS